MSPHPDDDPLIRALATLPDLAPDEARAARVRARCRARLERPPRQLSVPLEPATVGAVCAVYAWQIVRAVIRV
jgi:hypothetical protein